MGYGAQGAGDVIPGGATLNFDVEVVEISDKDPEQPNLFLMLDEDGDGKLSKSEIEVSSTVDVCICHDRCEWSVLTNGSCRPFS